MQARLDATRRFVQVFAIEHDNGAASPFHHDLIREVQQKKRLVGAQDGQHRRARLSWRRTRPWPATVVLGLTVGLLVAQHGWRTERDAPSLTARAYSAELGADGWRFHDPQIGQWSHRSAGSAASTGRSTSHMW